MLVHAWETTTLFQSNPLQGMKTHRDRTDDPEPPTPTPTPPTPPPPPPQPPRPPPPRRRVGPSRAPDAARRAGRRAGGPPAAPPAAAAGAARAPSAPGRQENPVVQKNSRFHKRKSPSTIPGIEILKHINLSYLT